MSRSKKVVLLLSKYLLGDTPVVSWRCKAGSAQDCLFRTSRNIPTGAGLHLSTCPDSRLECVVHLALDAHLLLCHGLFCFQWNPLYACVSTATTFFSHSPHLKISRDCLGHTVKLFERHSQSGRSQLTFFYSTWNPSDDFFFARRNRRYLCSHQGLWARCPACRSQSWRLSFTWRSEIIGGYLARRESPKNVEM